MLPADGCDSTQVLSSMLLLSVHRFILLSGELEEALERTVRELGTCIQWGNLCYRDIWLFEILY